MWERLDGRDRATAYAWVHDREPEQCGRRINPVNALEMAEGIEPYGILFCEEPVLPENIDASPPLRTMFRYRYDRVEGSIGLTSESCWLRLAVAPQVGSARSPEPRRSHPGGESPTARGPRGASP